MAQTQIYTQLAQVFCVEETTGGTFVEPAKTDAILAEDVQFSLSEESKRLGVYLNGFNQSDEIMTRAYGTLTFKVPLIGGGSTDGTDAPECGELLKACGFVETSGTATVSYAPGTDFDGTGGNPGESYSFSTIINGIRYGIAGAFGKVTFNFTAGDVCYAEVEAMGKYNAVATDDLFTGTDAPSYTTDVPPAYTGAQFAMTVGTDATSITGVTSFSLDMGTNLVTLADVAQSYGYTGSRISGHSPSGSFACELESDLSPNHYSLWAANTTASLDTGYVGSAGNRFKITVDRSTLRAPEWEDREGIHGVTQGFSVSAASTATSHPVTVIFA